MGATRKPAPLKAVIFLLLAMFCGYGLLASFEPGTFIAWKIGYGLGILVFLLLTLRSLTRG
ncbi:MAG: hypothetical protein P8M22_00045 [Phycisphaerales bacterium]|nr:hypothetical protein [Phycisphaerales bacterium]